MKSLFEVMAIFLAIGEISMPYLHPNNLKLSDFDSLCVVLVYIQVPQIIFFFLNQIISCGYSKELSQ